eukprot:4403368-Amphidinium_carterae.2
MATNGDIVDAMLVQFFNQMHSAGRSRETAQNICRAVGARHWQRADHQDTAAQMPSCPPGSTPAPHHESAPSVAACCVGAGPRLAVPHASLRCGLPSHVAHVYAAGRTATASQLSRGACSPSFCSAYCHQPACRRRDGQVKDKCGDRVLHSRLASDAASGSGLRGFGTDQSADLRLDCLQHGQAFLSVGRRTAVQGEVCAVSDSAWRTVAHPEPHSEDRRTVFGASRLSKSDTSAGATSSGSPQSSQYTSLVFADGSFEVPGLSASSQR